MYDVSVGAPGCYVSEGGPGCVMCLRVGLGV